MSAIFRTLLLIVMSALTNGAAAQTTSFTYQGQLKDGLNLAQGQHDFRFRLYDAASGGSQLGTTQCVDNILVNDGVFTATIDFGNQFASPAPRFIEIDVRRDTGLSCANVGGFVVLAPRQPITPAPTAIQAASAFSLAAPDGSPAKAVFVDNNGKVGVGTTTPANQLSVAGNANVTGNVGIGTSTPGAPLHIVSTSFVPAIHIASPFAVMYLQDTGPDSTQAGYVSYRNATGTETAWMGFGNFGDIDFSIVNGRAGGDIVLSPLSGNVGIGTATPAARLDVRGEVRYGSAGQYRPIAGEEPLRTIRGKADSSGGLIVGLGWSAVRESTGTFKVTFATPFTGAPVVTASADASLGFVVATVSDVSSSSARIRLRDSGDSLVNLQFGFIAVGPR